MTSIITEAGEQFMIDAANKDPINPPHYKDRVPGIECIEVTQHFGFCLGNAIKYIWRAGLKGDTVEDLRKAIWYIEKEIESLGGGERESKMWVDVESGPDGLYVVIHPQGYARTIDPRARLRVEGVTGIATFMGDERRSFVE